MQRGAWKNAHTLCYPEQSRPPQMAYTFAHRYDRSPGPRREKNLLIVPVAFVTEHIETLHEINIEAREQAHKLASNNSR
jgi:protoheme ferro-lyase